MTETLNDGMFIRYTVAGEELLFRNISNIFSEFEEQFTNAESYRKTAIVQVRVAVESETIITQQDGMTNQAEIGDFIIKNPEDSSEYVFGNRGDALEVRTRKFDAKYEFIADKPGFYQSKGVIQAVQVNENITFLTQSNRRMYVKAGGWVTSTGYGIAEESFNKTYERIEE